jgi:hypothetical protein
LVVEIDATKLNIEWIGLEGGELIQNPVTMQTGGKHGRKEKLGSGIVPENN